MSQPLPEEDEGMVVVPNVVGLPVSSAGPKVTDVGLEPVYKDKSGNKITNPSPEWYVQPEGESPEGGTHVPIDSVVTLIIAASVSKRK
ncbi:MAG TPA: hypothetical protein PKA37_10860 [Planctomycetota bacterium]|nr:hypothetical protein [Planctomycetota bacterium]